MSSLAAGGIAAAVASPAVNSATRFFMSSPYFALRRSMKSFS